jgi:hypothetical protein
LLSDIWKLISEEESDPFVEVSYLQDVVGSRLKDNIGKKRDI